jgi:hypothetical protein
MHNIHTQHASCDSATYHHYPCAHVLQISGKIHLFGCLLSLASLMPCKLAAPGHTQETKPQQACITRHHCPSSNPQQLQCIDSSYIYRICGKHAAATHCMPQQLCRPATRNCEAVDPATNQPATFVKQCSINCMLCAGDTLFEHLSNHSNACLQ